MILMCILNGDIGKGKRKWLLEKIHFPKKVFTLTSSYFCLFQKRVNTF